MSELSAPGKQYFPKRGGRKTRSTDPEGERAG